MATLHKLLVEMEESEYILRQAILSKGELSTGYHPDIRALHELHVDTLLSYFEKNDWPDFDHMANNLQEAFYLVAIHAISRPSYMKQILSYLQQFDSESALNFQAHLMDRIAFFERRAQLYGTQWDINLIGETVLWQVANRDKLNERRRQMALDEFVELDFALIDLDLSTGLKRQISQYNFIYEIGWLKQPSQIIGHFLSLFADYHSGFIFGPRYSSVHLLNGQYDDINIDIIIPTQLRAEFDDFAATKSIIKTVDGFKHATYAYKIEDYFYHANVYFIEFIDHADEWDLAVINAPVHAITEHTTDGWILKASAIIEGQGHQLWDVGLDTIKALKALLV